MTITRAKGRPVGYVVFNGSKMIHHDYIVRVMSKKSAIELASKHDGLRTIYALVPVAKAKKGKK